MPRDISKLDVYLRASELVPAVYRLCERLGPDERFGLQAQLRRAVLSISTNIAEGASRPSARDYLRFLDIARGSAVEVLHLLEAIRLTDLASDTELTSCRNDCSVVVQSLKKLQLSVRTWCRPTRPRNRPRP